MKNNFKTLFVCLLLLSINKIAFTQTLSDFLGSSQSKMTWLGIDFSEARLYGDATSENWYMKDRYFPSINDLVILEPKKYDVAKAFRKNNVAFELSITRKVNDNLDIDKFKTNSTEDLRRLNPEKIDSMIEKYDFGKNSGFGVVFIMEGMDKVSKTASIFVTIVNMDSKKVLLTKRMVAPPRGFGFRNYWAYTVFLVLREIDNSQYKKWKLNTN